VIGRLATHSLTFAFGLLAPVRLTPSEREFIEANRALWHEVFTPASTKGELLVEPMFHPVILHGNASFAAIASRARGLRLLFTLQSHADRRTKALLSSYAGARFTYLYSPRTVPAWIAAWLRAGRVYRRLREPQEILELSEDGYRYGDIIYDALLARGYATVRAVDFWTLLTLQRYFFYQAAIARIVREHDVRAYVTTQSYIGLLLGTFARALMRRRIEVLARVTTLDLIVRRSRGPEGIWRYELRPDPPILAALLDDPTGEAIQHADRHIEQRLAQATRDPTAKLPFDRSRRLYVDRKTFATQHGLDPSRPLVFVMLHAFNDYPHSHFRRPLMFQDFYDWFVQTVDRARGVTSVNWVFKEHPGAEYYITRDFDLRSFMGSVTAPHMLFLRSDADFNAASIRHIGHAIVTCIGTAGLEYACFGIPCVLAGESPYTGYDFTREPADRDSYFRELDAIASINRLSDEQMRVARLVAWYELGLVYEIPYLLGIPYMAWQVADFKKIDVWHDAAAILRAVDRDALRRQMRMIAEFLESDEHQLLDFEKYPFLRAAAVGPVPTPVTRV